MSQCNRWQVPAAIESDVVGWPQLMGPPVGMALRGLPEWLHVPSEGVGEDAKARKVHGSAASLPELGCTQGSDACQPPSERRRCDARVDVGEQALPTRADRTAAVESEAVADVAIDELGIDRFDVEDGRIHGRRPLDEFDPVLSALQQLWDLVDPIAHGRFLVEEPHEGISPTHALQHSGLEDGYFSPESRAALSTAIGAQIVEPLIEDVAMLSMELRGLDTVLTLPAGGNREGVTALVTQYEPSVLDGHNVAFQREDTQVQYACFTLSVGVEAAPRVFSVADSGPGECLR